MTITDADREAARALAMTLFGGVFEPSLIAHTFQQAFARHRIAALEEALRACRAHQYSPAPYTDITATIRALKGDA